MALLRECEPRERGTSSDPISWHRWHRSAAVCRGERYGIERTETLALLPDDELTAAHKKNLSGGLLIRVTKPVMRPLIITHTLATSTCWHTLIIIEDGASAKVIESFEGEAKNVSHYTEVKVGENATLFYADTQGIQGDFITRKYARLARDASMDWFELTANQGTTYSRITSTLSAENAGTSISTIYLGRKDARMDVGAEAVHEAMHGRSKLLTKGVLAGEAKAIYEGTLRMGARATKSDAYQEEHALLLSEGADAKASPMLFIDNNDVSCSHAATVGKPDEERLFYLQTRGLSSAAAKRLLIKAFVWPVIEAVPDYARQSIIAVAEPLIKRFAEFQLEEG